MGDVAVSYLVAVNLLACFVEGGLGFGGSLAFLAFTVPVVGWSTGIMADAILASANLLATAALYNRELDLRRVAFPAWAVALLPLLVGTVAFMLLPGPWRVIPLLGLGAVMLWTPKPVPRCAFVALAGLGIGLGNSCAPWSFMYFQSERPDPGNTALFTAGLMLSKVVILLALWPVAVLPPWSWMAVMAISGLPATWFGGRVMSRWSQRTRIHFVRALVTALLLILLLGVRYAP